MTKLPTIVSFRPRQSWKERVKELHRHGRRTILAVIPEEESPDDAIQTLSKEGFLVSTGHSPRSLTLVKLA